MAHQDQLDAMIVQDAPEASETAIAPVPSRAEERVMPIRDRTLFLGVLEVLAQPVFLRLPLGVGETAIHDHFTIEGDDMPFTEVIAVIAFVG